jgi:hypothetical protein
VERFRVGEAPGPLFYNVEKNGRVTPLLGKQLGGADGHRPRGGDRGDRSAEHDPDGTPTGGENGDDGPPHRQAGLGRPSFGPLRVGVLGVLRRMASRCWVWTRAAS